MISWVYEKFMKYDKYDNAWFFVNPYVHNLKLIDTEKERRERKKEKEKEGNGIFMLTQFYFSFEIFLLAI